MDPRFRSRVRLVMEAASANVAGMQQLYYPACPDYDPAACGRGNDIVYNHGGLALPAGCKVFPAAGSGKPGAGSGKPGSGSGKSGSGKPGGWEHADLVARLKRERKEFPSFISGLGEPLVKPLG